MITEVTKSIDAPLLLIIMLDSLTSIANVHFQCLILEVVRYKDFNMTSISVFECIFQEVDQNLFQSDLISLESSWQLTIFTLH